MLFSFLCFLEWDNKNTVTSRIPARFPDCPFQIFRNKVFSDVAGGIYRLKLSDGCWKQFVNAQLPGKFCEFVTPFFGGWWKREHFQWWKRDFQRSGMKRSRLGNLGLLSGYRSGGVWLVLSDEVFANSVVGIVEIFFTQKVADWKNHAGIENCVNQVCLFIWGEVPCWCSGIGDLYGEVLQKPSAPGDRPVELSHRKRISVCQPPSPWNQVLIRPD